MLRLRNYFFTSAVIPLAIFFSGAASLIYEVLWLRMLIRVFGITLYATSTIVAVFMGGLALGSWFFGKWSQKHNFTLKSYGFIELGIGVSSLLSTVFISNLPFINNQLHILWRITPVESIPVATLRFALASVAMLLPTMLMGSTLPLLTKIMAMHDKHGDANLAFLYGINTLGAVMGILFSGFFSIGILGETTTMSIAIALNIGIGIILLKNDMTLATPNKSCLVADKNLRSPNNQIIILSLAAISGFCAIGLEILWSRILILLIGTSVYAFSIMLSLYLAGIGVGSLIYRKWNHRISSLVSTLGFFLMAFAVFGLGSLYEIRFFGLRATDMKFLYSPLTAAPDFFWMLGVAALVILPIALLFGFTFPLFGQLLITNIEQTGNSVGVLYGVNTIGGVVGSISLAFFLIPKFGTQGSYLLLCALLFLSGFLFLLKERQRKLKTIFIAGLIGLVFVGGIPSKKIIFLDILARRLNLSGPGSILFHKEESTATLTGYESAKGKILLINGIVISGKGIPGALMAHIPLLLHSHPSRALVVCFGAGNTFRAAHDHVGNVDVVELVKGVIDNNSYFYDDTSVVFSDPRVRFYINDGRNFMLTSRNIYDVIIVDASPPIFSEGTVNLYSKEFVRLCKNRLDKNGILCLWVPTPCFESDFWMIARNFSDTFGHTFVWTHPSLAGVLLMGSSASFDISMEELKHRILSRHLQDKAPWLQPDLLQKGWSLSENEVQRISQKYPAITDDHPYTEYPLYRFLRKEHFWNTTEFILKAKQSSN